MKEIRILTGVRAVTAAGTPERINEEANKLRSQVISIVIRANTGNAGLIYVGFDPASATAGAAAYALSPGETSPPIDVSQFADAYVDLQNVWLDAETSGDGVSFIAIEVI